MTAQDAFAIAFDDEAWAMDAMPGNDMPKNNLPSKPAAPSGLKKNAGAAPDADTSMGGEKSLSQHLQEGCEAQKNGHPERCPYIKKMAKELEQSQGLDHAAAMQQAIGIHTAEANKLAGGQPQQPQTVPQAANADNPQQPQPVNQEAQEAAAQELANQGPAAVVNKLGSETNADRLPQPKVVQTEAGPITTETVAQLASVIVNETEKAKGNPLGEKADAQLVQAQKDGTITTGENQLPQDDKAVAAAPQAVEEPKPETMASSDGSFMHELTPEQSAIIKEHPEKKELLQKIIDASGRQATSTDEKEKEQIAAGIKMLNQMFSGGESTRGKENVDGGDDGKGNGEETVQPNGTATPPPTPTPTSGGEGGNGGSNPPPTPPTDGGDGGQEEPTPPNNPPNPPNNPPNNTPDNPPKPPEKPSAEEEGRGKYVSLAPAPSDEEFRIGKNKYNVGGTIYTDVSGKGLLRGMLASFMAGLRGEGIITGWDRINGTWDAMKRSEKGEMVRDGIASALCRDTISKYANKDGLSDEAKMEIAVIQDMMEQAETPEAQMKAVKQFQKWKETYSKELGELEKPVAGQTFKPLPNDYKGTKPPVSILKAAEGFNADKEFGEKVAAGLEERLGILGLQTEGLAGVSVGPSATTVKFKVPPTFDITAANSKKSRESLKGAIGGSEVSSVEYAKGETDVIAITVTNPEMRNVAFSDVINSKRWKDFAKKAALPIPLGRDSSGEETMLDAATMPQTIVTGATGSGKSVFISSAINGIEMEKTPNEARIVLLDPKNEFKIQDGSPHLLFPRAGGDPDKAKASKDMADVLDSLVAIMNDRVTKIGGVVDGFDPSKNEFKGAAEHSIKQYNEAHPDDKMPHILLVFDEIANARDNATAADKARIDLALQKLTAVGRSVGVNCLLSTQRDDVGSIPGIIQANCPGRVTFKASPTDAKASQEAKSLAGNGDYILTDKGGNKTRGRGCFISPEEEMAIPSYYRDHMNGGDIPAEPEQSLPKEYTDGIAQAVKNKQPVSVQAIEGMEEAFKKALPDGWTIEHEKVDGDDHWKATPPKPTMVEVPDGNGAKEEEPSDDWRNSSNRQEAVDSLNKRLQDAKSAAWEEFKKSKNTTADKQKYTKAVEKAEAELQADLEIVNSQFPEQIANGDEPDDDEGGENPTGENPDNGESPNDEGDTPAAMMKDVESQLKAEKERIDKALSKPTLKLRERRKLRQEKAELQKRFDAAKAKFDAGGSADDILNIFEPEENKEEPDKGETPPADGGSGENPADNGGADDDEAQKQEQENERRRNSVPPQKGYSENTIAGSYEATERLTPKDQKAIKERFLPDGWEFVTQNGFNAPAKNKFGVVFVHDPATGSQGRLIPDQNNPKGYKFQKDIDTTHPEFKGYVQKPDGTWELSPEGKKVEEETRLDRKQSRDDKKREEALKRFNRARYGHDEAPDNKTIVANAVMEALNLIER